MRKFKIVTLGCRTNQYESQAYADQLMALGWQRAQGEEKADLCLVNTCTVTENADHKSLYALRRLKRENPEARIVATGCFATRDPASLTALGAQVVSNASKETLLADLFPDLEDLPEFSIRRFDAHQRAFVKVQDGCNSYCSYCIIPLVRGRSRSRTVDDIVSEVATLVAEGYPEVVLTGINIGDFDGGGGKTLADLVRAVDAVPGLKRLRLSSIDPDEIDDALVHALLDGEKTCKSLHMVLQSGSNTILKRMRRKYTVQDFFRTWEKLKEADPSFTLTTDVIVGFPGETDADFEATSAVVQECLFAHVHIFPFSVRPKTRAERMDGHLPAAEIRRRKKLLERTAEKAAFALREKFVGKEETLLIEQKDPMRKGWWMGHSGPFLTLSIPHRQGLKAGDLVPVTCLKNTPSGLLCTF